MPKAREFRLARRRVIGQAAALTGLAWAGPLAAATATPPATRGPFYPVARPLEDDANLAEIGGKRAQGQIIRVGGRVLDARGRAVAGARVEIWQANAFGRYHHPGDTSSKMVDPNFQGTGFSIADAAGDYRFMTIKPPAYGVGSFMRTPHIHFRIAPPTGGELVTQMYFAGEALNAQDGVLNQIRDPAARAAVIIVFRSQGDGALSGTFDIVFAA
jgi:protocatechuate 3,4-dioxygenase beta subunit